MERLHGPICMEAAPKKGLHCQPLGVLERLRQLAVCNVSKLLQRCTDQKSSTARILDKHKPQATLGLTSHACGSGLMHSVCCGGFTALSSCAKGQEETGEKRVVPEGLARQWALHEYW